MTWGIRKGRNSAINPGTSRQVRIPEVLIDRNMRLGTGEVARREKDRRGGGEPKRNSSLFRF
jgi:hypothetical protein